MKLADLTWPEVENVDRGIVVLYPIAALEQHSRHLPFFTDSILCDAVAARVEEVLPDDTLLLPTQWLGASAHHLGMAGTLSADLDTHVKLICEPLRCLLQHGFKRLFILNGHGGNIDGFHFALRQLAIEYPEALLSGASYWDLAEKQIAALLQGHRKTVGHACEFETSMMMHLRPDLVRTKSIVDDEQTSKPEEVRGVYIPLDMKQQTQHGGAGQATRATPENGKALFEAVTLKAVETVRALKTMPLGQPRGKTFPA